MCIGWLLAASLVIDAFLQQSKRGIKGMGHNIKADTRAWKDKTILTLI